MLDRRSHTQQPLRSELAQSSAIVVLGLGFESTIRKLAPGGKAPGRGLPGTPIVEK